MTFGYIGYIWALLGCACFGMVFGGSAVLLYGIARRDRAARPEPKVSVERVGGVGPKPPDAA